MQLPWLPTDRLLFPPLDAALEEPNGLLAAGGDLSAERLLEAYQRGIFPWYEPDQPILWWSPDPRCVLFPERIHISRSLKKSLSKQLYRVSMDEAFSHVIRACAAPRQDTDGTWISTDMERAYIELHQRGIAHSVEAWSGDELVGGLYGLAIGQVFFGESMFSRRSDTSKISLVHLCGQLRDWGYKLIDCQVDNPHLQSLGAELLPRNEFIGLLNRYSDGGGQASPWRLLWSPEL